MGTGWGVGVKENLLIGGGRYGVCFSFVGARGGVVFFFVVMRVWEWGWTKKFFFCGGGGVGDKKFFFVGEKFWAGLGCE